jgi:hypothetical protein
MAQKGNNNAGKSEEPQKVKRDPINKNVACPLCSFLIGSVSNPAPLEPTTCPRCEHVFMVYE